MTLQELGILGIASIWSLAVVMIFAMKKIAPYMKGYPVYAVVVASLFTAFTLFRIFKS